MNALILFLSIVAVLSLTAVAIALFALHQFRTHWRPERQDSESTRSQTDTELSLLRSSIEMCCSQIRELQQQHPAAVSPLAPKVALNLGKRSQAIRMHRHGDSPDTIATALEIPRQEVDLLLKVHRIVISNLGN